MLVISKPYIEDKDGISYLICNISDKEANTQTKLWFSVSSFFKEYLCSELADAFLLGLLPIAIKSNKDIMVDASVSARLSYNIQTSIIPMYQKIFHKNGGG